MKALLVITVAALVTGCRGWYPELNGTYVEDKAATIAYIKKHNLSNAEAIEAYGTGLCMTVTIKNDVLSKQCRDIRFDHRVHFKKIDDRTFQFRYPYDQGSDVFIFLEDDGIWLTVHGEPQLRLKYNKQDGTNTTPDGIRQSADGSPKPSL